MKIYKATIYYTLLYWHDVPEHSPEFNSQPELDNWIEEEVSKINRGANTSFKHSKGVVTT